VFADLLVTGWPDREADAVVGKRTLPTRLSVATLRTLHAGAVVAGFGGLGVLHGCAVPATVCWATLPGAPLLAWGVATFTRRRSPFPTVAGDSGRRARAVRRVGGRRVVKRISRGRSK
jgi:1,4-dihydroxy-2-naphthoate octaprenyltransferase